ncbi:MAG: N-acetylmuramic acid 6-phosphate etherase [Planctomycetes bacterium]|nr:N-acetylmuramic acid 6-phosphate etherase [Planctomycetota bacterium]
MSDVPLEHLTTEARNPASRDLDRLTALEFVRLMNREDRVAVDAVAAAGEAIARAIDAAAERMARGGRLIYAGAGTSGRLGLLDAAECPPTFNVPGGVVVGLIAGGERAFVHAVEGAEDSEALGATDVARLAVGARDVVVGIAASGRTPYAIGVLRAARARGALTIAIACNRAAPISDLAEHAIEVVTGPEVLTGSTRLKAGTAQKLVLNLLSTGVMVKLGKTYGNLMVDVQATNQKLLARSRRIVADATGLEPAAAARALDAAGGEVKTAIVAARLSIDPAIARERLRAANGRVRDALGE